MKTQKFEEKETITRPNERTITKAAWHYMKEAESDEQEARNILNLDNGFNSSVNGKH